MWSSNASGERQVYKFNEAIMEDNLLKNSKLKG